jgi:hypothetical protein
MGGTRMLNHGSLASYTSIPEARENQQIVNMLILGSLLHN